MCDREREIEREIEQIQSHTNGLRRRMRFMILLCNNPKQQWDHNLQCPQYLVSDLILSGMSQADRGDMLLQQMHLHVHTHTGFIET